MAVVALTPAIASAAPLSFSPAGTIDAGTPLHAVSCPSISLCVIAGGSSHLDISNNPEASAYTTVQLASPDESLNGVSCPSTTFCVAVDGDGNAYVSSDPTAQTAAGWAEISDIDGDGAALDGVSCPSTTVCLAVGFAGAFVSTNAGAIWSQVLGTSGIHFTAVSCPTAGLCVAVANGTQAVTFTNLEAGAGAVVTAAPSADSRGADHLTAVSCPASALCVAVDDGGYAAVSTDPSASDWDEAVATGAGGGLAGVACPLVALCLAASTDGAVTFSSDAVDGASSMWGLDASGFDAHALDALACPESGLCVAIDSGGGESVGSGAMLGVALAGAGGGTVTDSDGYIDCGLTCSAYYAAGSSVTLTAAAGPGSTFAGWSGAGCSGTGTCTITNGQAGTSAAVTASFNPPPSETTITKVAVERRRHRATFHFTATYSPEGYECELVRATAARRHRRHRHHTPHAPAYHACRSPQSYGRLERGSYTFYVYAVGPGGSDPTPASAEFTIR